jgi:hypothetical protein
LVGRHITRAATPVAAIPTMNVACASAPVFSTILF